MNEYIILTDSTCDLPADIAQELGLLVVSLSVILDGTSYKNYLDGRELSFQDFYESMRNKKLPTTSAVNVYDFLELMEPILVSGKDILYLGFSSPMSSTYSAGCVAIKDLKQKYPERKILTVDTLSASLGEGLLVYLCAMEKKKGCTIEEVQAFAEANKMHICHLLTVDDLFHIKRGGRISASSAILGSMLGVKPILQVDDGGLMNTIGKARGRRAAIRSIVDMIKDNITDLELPIFIGHGDCLDEAEQVAEMLKEQVGVKKVIINYIGVVCGSHSGPGILGIFFHGKKR